MGRQAPAEVAEDAHAVDVLDPLDEDDVGALGNGEVDREVGGWATWRTVVKRGMPQLVAGERELPELVEVDAEAVVAGRLVLLDEAAGDQRLEQPVCGRLGDPEPPGDVRDAELTVHGEALEHVEGRPD